MVVGITGSIACGKSLVSNYLKSKNYPIIDSDVISHNVLLLEDVKKQLIQTFGNNILTIDNEINRKELGSIIFNDINQKQKLQDIVFPYILDEIKRKINSYSGLIFLDAPLLIEYDILYLVDKVIVVSLDLNKQIERLMNRDNITKEYALKKINSVLSSKEKEKYADYIIDNNNDIKNTYNQIDNILKKLGELYEN